MHTLFHENVVPETVHKVILHPYSLHYEKVIPGKHDKLLTVPGNNNLPDIQLKNGATRDPAGICTR